MSILWTSARSLGPTWGFWGIFWPRRQWKKTAMSVARMWWTCGKTWRGHQVTPRGGPWWMKLTEHMTTSSCHGVLWILKRWPWKLGARVSGTIGRNSFSFTKTRCLAVGSVLVRSLPNAVPFRLKKNVMWPCCWMSGSPRKVKTFQNGFPVLLGKHVLCFLGVVVCCVFASYSFAI